MIDIRRHRAPSEVILEQMTTDIEPFLFYFVFITISVAFFCDNESLTHLKDSKISGKRYDLIKIKEGLQNNLIKNDLAVN